MGVKLEDIFNERELRLINNARVYAANDPAGIAGHNLLLIIDKFDKLVKILEAKIESQQGQELNEKCN